MIINTAFTTTISDCNIQAGYLKVFFLVTKKPRILKAILGPGPTLGIQMLYILCIILCRNKLVNGINLVSCFFYIFTQ